MRGRIFPSSPRWLWPLCALLLLVSCGDDDSGSFMEPDAGEPCNPDLGGVSTCTCMTGSPGVRQCIRITRVWGACFCNEPMPPMPCEEGSFVACGCPDGSQSTQLCRASNTRDPCMCPNNLPMDSGSDDASSLDAAPDSQSMDAASDDDAA